MPRYSLVNVWKRHDDGFVDGSWIQDSTGTLEKAFLKARRTEKANSGRISVAVVHSFMGAGISNFTPRTRLKEIMEGDDHEQ